MLAEVGNVVGCYNRVHHSPVDASSDVNHEWANQLLERGFISERRPSQLPENHRCVSVRVDLVRWSDGKAMCLLDEQDVGVTNREYWPGEAGYETDTDDDPFHQGTEFIALIPEEDWCGADENLLPNGDGDLAELLVDGEYIVGEPFDIVRATCAVAAEWPVGFLGDDDMESGDRSPGELRLRGVSLRFLYAVCPPWQDTVAVVRSYNCLGARAAQTLRALDAWA